MSGLSREQVADLEGLLAHPGWDLFRAEAARQAKGASNRALNNAAVTDRERADAALTFRVLDAVVGWPAKQIVEHHNREE